MTDEKSRDIESLADIVLNPKNPNQGSERGNWQLEESLRRYGAARSIVVDKYGRVIAGNHVVSIAGQMGLDGIEVIRTNGDKIVIVQREDLDLETDPRAKELVYVDNRVSEVNYVLDTDILLDDLAGGGIDLQPFYMEEELEYLTAGADLGDDGDIDEDEDSKSGEDSSDDEDDEPWTQIKMQVKQSTLEHFESLMERMSGDDEDEQFTHLLEFTEIGLNNVDDQDDYDLDDEDTDDDDTPSEEE